MKAPLSAQHTFAQLFSTVNDALHLDREVQSMLLTLEGFNGREQGTNDALGSFLHPLQRRAIAEPYCHTLGKDAVC